MIGIAPVITALFSIKDLISTDTLKKGSIMKTKIIRWILTVAILVPVYRETGPFTCWAIALICLASEMTSATICEITKRLEEMAELFRQITKDL